MTLYVVLHLAPAGTCTGRRLANRIVTGHEAHARLPVHHLLRPSACAAGCRQRTYRHLDGACQLRGPHR